MRPRSFLVVHPERMLAEGIAARLAQQPALVPLGVATNAAEARQMGERADLAVIERTMCGADEAAAALRRRGTRVVFLGEANGEEDGVCVPTRSPIAALVGALVPDAPVPSPRGRLTPRELDVLALVARGLPGKQIARHLGISPKTVEIHKTRIFAKLGVANQTAAVSRALPQLQGVLAFGAP
ncbi:MAG: response regulator transcription factor [Actinomycetota bacterium]